MTLLLQLKYLSAMERVTREAPRPPASLSGAPTCQRSGVCCWRRPCDLHPGDDVARLASFLGLSPERLFADYLVVDVGADDGLRLRPRRAHQDGGTTVSVEESWSVDTPCVFLDGDVCRVHDAKPTGGAQWSCAMTPEQMRRLPDPSWDADDLAALGWTGEIDP